MRASDPFVMRFARPSIVLVAVMAAFAVGALQPGVRAAEPSAGPAASGSPVASQAPKTMCESYADLRLYIDYLRDQSLDEGGLLPILVGAAASISEARTLAGLVNETYRPLVAELVTSLDDLASAVRGFRDQGTVGTGLVQLGEAIAGIGLAMDALSSALREPCPSAPPTTSAPPAVAASPAA